MKDIYRIMANQNILNFYGSKLDLRVDYSELYDYEIDPDKSDYNTEVLDFTNEITYTGLTVDSTCLTGDTLDNLKPWVIEINSPYTGDTCDFTVRRRTEKGWTLDFVFNKENIDWSGGTTFYYWGISGETVQENYGDNNLSFSFTNDGRIKWEAYRYSGICNTTSGYTESYYISSGQTPVLCTNGTSTDFNVTITFDRYSHYELCEIENEGGWNDLIRDPFYTIAYSSTTSGQTSTQIATGYTTTNPYEEWLTGATETTSYVEMLNKKWADEYTKRLGKLKIYLNGKPIYTLKNWEEVIPSLRESENSIVQIFGGGVTGYNTIHTGETEFTLEQVKYFEEPLDYVHVKHHYLTSIKPNFDITECNETTTDDVYLLGIGKIISRDGSNLITQDDVKIMYRS